MYPVKHKVKTMANMAVFVVILGVGVHVVAAWHTNIFLLIFTNACTQFMYTCLHIYGYHRSRDFRCEYCISSFIK